MNKFGKIKLSYVYIGGISLIILVLVFSLGILSVLSVESLGNYATEVNSENINKGISALASEYTEELAVRYSSLFNMVKQAVNAVRKTTEYFLNSNDYQINPAAKNLISKTLIPYHNYFINPLESNVSVCYWGNEKTITSKIRADLDNLTYIVLFLAYINELSPTFYEVWVENLRDSYFICTPRVSQLYESVGKNDFYDHCKKEYQREVSKYKFVDNNPDFIWTTPQFEIGSENQVTFNVECPLFGKDHEFIGFTGIDIDILKMLNSFNIEHLKNNDSFRDIFNKTFLLNETGTIIEFPDDLYDGFGIKKPVIAQDASTGKRYIDVNPKLSESSNKNVKNLYHLLSSELTGVKYIDVNNGKNYMVTFARIKTNNWVTGVIIPSEYLYSSIHMTIKKMGLLKIGLTINFLLLSLLFFFAAIVLSVIFFRYLIMNPINKIQDVVKQLGTGNFDVYFDKIETAEFSSLMKGVQKLGKDLTIYTDNLKKEITSRQAMETELDIAAQVQNSILPRITEKFVRLEFELYAKLEPAKYIGGDFYDFFYINDNLLAIVIADISGKGISAAMYMGMAKATIKNVCFREDLEFDPGKIMFKINNHFTRDNDAGMFVTSQLVFYNLKTGDFTYTSAGHHDMLKMNIDGEIKTLGVSSTVLGLFKDNIYPVGKNNLEPDDSLILFTDGVIEAINPAKEFYGDERFAEILKKSCKKSAREIADDAINSVMAFEEGNRFDDITVIILKRKSNTK